MWLSLAARPTRVVVNCNEAKLFEPTALFQNLPRHTHTSFYLHNETTLVNRTLFLVFTKNFGEVQADALKSPNDPLPKRDLSTTKNTH
jgi:hypothetical protein